RLVARPPGGELRRVALERTARALALGHVLQGADQAMGGSRAPRPGDARPPVDEADLAVRADDPVFAIVRPLAAERGDGRAAVPLAVLRMDEGEEPERVRLDRATLDAEDAVDLVGPVLRHRLRALAVVEVELPVAEAGEVLDLVEQLLVA